MLFRLDSGYDSAENIGILLEHGCHFIIKHNLRKESKEDWLGMAKDNSLDITHSRGGKDVYIRKRLEGNHISGTGRLSITWSMRHAAYVFPDNFIRF